MPRGSSRARTSRRRSMPGSHRIRGHGCAWDTCRSRLRCSIGSIKNVRTRRLERVMLAARASASGPRAVTFKRMGQEDPRAYQTHQCRNRLDHRLIPFRPAREKTRAALHSQKNSRGKGDNGGGVRLRRNSLCRGGTSEQTAMRTRLRRSTGRSERPVYHPGVNAVRSPFPPCSGCVIVTTSDAVVGRLGAKDRTALPVAKAG